MSNVSSSERDLSQDEIDLLKVFSQLNRFFGRYGKIILLAIVAGTLLGVVAFFVLPKKYEVKMIADARLLSSQEVIGIVEQWEDLLNNKEYKIIAQKLNVSPDIVRQVNKFDAESGDIIIRPDQNADPFIITAVVFNNNIVDSLQSGIVNYLENNDYMRRRVDSDRKKFLLLKERIKGEIAQLDTVKQSVQQLINRPQNSAGTLITDPGNVNVRQLDLYNRLLEVDQQLEFLNNVQVITGFEKAEHQDYPKLPLCLGVGAALGLLTGLLTGFLMNINRNVSLF